MTQPKHIRVPGYRLYSGGAILGGGQDGMKVWDTYLWELSKGWEITDRGRKLSRGLQVTYDIEMETVLGGNHDD